MLVIHSIKQAREIVNEWKCNGETIGLVPTMGYLHTGHESLIQIAKMSCSKVVVTIFVNPLQFGPNEDFEKYPRDIEADTKLCQLAEVDMIFAPTVDEMYPEKSYAKVVVDEITEGLCGKSRPGHFQGVATVVTKLFHIIPANRAFFGQKDVQQLAVIQSMVRDLNFDLEIIACPTIRERDGLPCSSRNSYLTVSEREIAGMIPQSLLRAKELLRQGEVVSQKILNEVESILRSCDKLKVDYLQIVDPLTLKPLDKIEGKGIIVIAVFVGKTRLIDHLTWDITNE